MESALSPFEASEQVSQGIDAFLGMCRAKDWDSADRTLGELAKLAAESSADSWAFSEAANTGGRVPEAVKAASAALEQKPGSGPLEECLARLLTMGRDYPSAGRHAQRAVSINPESPFAHNALGRSLLDSVGADSAIGPLKRAVDLAGGFSGFHLDLGLAYKKANLLPAAIREFQRAIELRSDFVRAYWLLADCLTQSGRHGEGTSVMRRLANVAPSAEVYVGLASMLVNDRRHAESEKYLRMAIDLDPSFAQAHDRLGNRLQQIGQFAEAEESFRRSIALNPDLPNSYLGFMRMKKATESDRPFIERMERMASEPNRSPEDLRLLSYALGKAYEDLGEYGKAMAHFDEANGGRPKLSSRGEPIGAKARWLSPAR